MLNWRRPFGGRRGVVAPEIKDSRTGPLIALTSAGRPRWTPRDYANLATEGFGRNAVAYRCVRMVAEAAASTPLAVFVDGVRRDDHPLALLLARPNPEQSGAEWLEALYGALQTAGNAYAEAVGDEAPAELWTLRPGRWRRSPLSQETRFPCPATSGTGEPCGSTGMRRGPPCSNPCRGFASERTTVLPRRPTVWRRPARRSFA